MQCCTNYVVRAADRLEKTSTLQPHLQRQRELARCLIGGSVMV